MKKPEIPPGERTRLETLRSLNLLDTAPEERFDRLTRLAKRLFGESWTPLAGQGKGKFKCLLRN